MARPKATINTVDLTRAIKAIRASGLAINYTTIDPDGTITLVHLPDSAGATSASPDDALAGWEAKRPAIQLAQNSTIR